MRFRTMMLLFILIFSMGSMDVTWAASTGKVNPKEMVGVLDRDVFLIMRNGKYGLYDQKQGKLIRLNCDYIWPFENGMALVQVGEKYGFINPQGQMVIRPQYDMAWEFYSDGLAIVMLDGKQGFIDKQGNVVVEPQYEDLWEAKEGLARVKVNDKYGFINRAGKMVIAPEFDQAFGFSSSGWAKISKDGQEGFVDQKGNVFFVKGYDLVYGFDNNGLARVVKNGLNGLIDLRGKEIAKPMYQQQGDFSEGYYAFKLKGKWGFLDAKGRMVIAPKYESAFGFVEGLSVFQKDGKYGFINPKEEVVIKPKFEVCDDFKEGLALVLFNDQFGYIDPKGNLVIKPSFPNARAFNKGVALVQLDDEWVYINQKGMVVARPGIEEVGQYSEYLDGLTAVKVNGLWGFMYDDTDRMVIKPQFDEVAVYAGNKGEQALATINGEPYLVARTGEVIKRHIVDEAVPYQGKAVSLGDSVLGDTDFQSYIDAAIQQENQNAQADSEFSVGRVMEGALQLAVKELALQQEIARQGTTLKVSNQEVERLLSQSFATGEELQEYLIVHGFSSKEALIREIAKKIERQKLFLLKARQLNFSVSEPEIRAKLEQITVRHILIGFTNSDGKKLRTPAQALARANEVYRKVMAGGDFAALVKQYSDDHGSKDKGGVYGPESVAEFQINYIESFVKAALALRKGQVSKPVKTEYGYHIIRLDQRGMPPGNEYIRKYAEVKDALLLSKFSSSPERDRWLQKLAEETEQKMIILDPALLAYRQSNEEKWADAAVNYEKALQLGYYAKRWNLYLEAANVYLKLKQPNNALRLLNQVPLEARNTADYQEMLHTVRRTLN